MVSQSNLPLPIPKSSQAAWDGAEAVLGARLQLSPERSHENTLPRLPRQQGDSPAPRCRHQLGPQPPGPPRPHPAPLYPLSNSLPSPSPKQRKKGEKEGEERNKTLKQIKTKTKSSSWEAALLGQLSKIKFRFIVGQHCFTHTSNRPKKRKKNKNKQQLHRQKKKKKTFLSLALPPHTNHDLWYS